MDMTMYGQQVEAKADSFVRRSTSEQNARAENLKKASDAAKEAANGRVSFRDALPQSGKVGLGFAVVSFVAVGSGALGVNPTLDDLITIAIMFGVVGVVLTFLHAHSTQRKASLTQEAASHAWDDNELAKRRLEEAKALNRRVSSVVHRMRSASTGDESLDAKRQLALLEQELDFELG